MSGGDVKLSTAPKALGIIRPDDGSSGLLAYFGAPVQFECGLPAFISTPALLDGRSRLRTDPFLATARRRSAGFDDGGG